MASTRRDYGRGGSLVGAVSNCDAPSAIETLTAWLGAVARIVVAIVFTEPLPRSI